MHIQLDISGQLENLLNRNNIQIFSFNVLSQALRNLYISGKIQGTLIYRNAPFSVHVKPVGDHRVGVIHEELSSYLKTGDRLILILPGFEKHRYVVQIEVEKLFVDRFMAAILDPRFNRRFKLLDAVPVRLWKVPPLVLVRLRNNNLSLFRQVEGLLLDENERPFPAGGAEGKGENLNPAAEHFSAPIIADYLYDQQLKTEAKEFSKLKESEFFQGSIGDVSQGGVCVGVRTPEAESLANNKLVYVVFTLARPNYSSKPAVAGEEKLGVRAFAMVRGYSPQEANAGHLHLMYLAGLPQSVRRFFPPPTKPAGTP